MAELGILGEDERLELVDGEIVKMSPKGARHQSAARRIARRLRRVFDENHWTVMENSALALDTFRERYPDVLVARGGEETYDDRVAGPSDVVLVVEVSDTTLEKDVGVKGPEYAAAGIPQYWVANMAQRRLEVRDDPAPGGYQNVRIYTLAESAPVTAVVASLTIPVADLFPKR
jgi:Uma2 family endonuclease